MTRISASTSRTPQREDLIPAPAVPPPRPLTPAAVLGLQRTCGNRAVDRLVGTRQVLRNGQTGPPAGERVRSDRSPQLRTPGAMDAPPDAFLGAADVQGAADLTQQVARAIAAGHYTNPLHRQLVNHYVHGGGAVYRLTRAQMHQVIASGSGNLNICGSTRWSEVQQLEEALAGQVGAGGPGVVTAAVRTSAEVDCDANLPSLGTFTAHVEGTLTASRGDRLSMADRGAVEDRASDAQLRNQLFARLGPVAGRPPRQLAVEPFDPASVYFSFSGTMHWYDRWDFDPHVPAGPRDPDSFTQRRTPDAERGVRRAHDWLPGAPFDVTTEVVSVNQRPGSSSATY